MLFLKRILAHELIKGSFFIFIGSTIANIFAFFFNFFLLRKLSPIDYGIYASLASIIALLTIPSQSINTIIVQFATKFLSFKNEKKAEQFYICNLQVIGVIGSIILLTIILLALPLGNFLRINNIYYFTFVGIIVSITYLSIINTAFLQSLIRFKFLAMLLLLSAVIKFISGVILITSGARVNGALWALFFSVIIPFIISFIPIKFLFKKTKEKINLPVKEIFLFALPAFICIFSLSSLTSTDIILVKHFFSPYNAGLYAKLSLIGRTIFYFTMPIPTVMFPLVIKRHSNGLNFHRLFFLSLLLVGLPSIAITVFYFVFPAFSINVFLGGENIYASLIPLIGIFGIYITIFSLLNVFIMFFLSLKKTNIALFIGITAVLQIILINTFHKNFTEIIYISLALSLLLLFFLLVYYWKLYGR
jgi:O-antigen/teichoic acid export membrane protein